MSHAYDQTDALGIAFFMGESDTWDWSAIDAGDHCVAAATAMKLELYDGFPDAVHAWDQPGRLPDWESFLSKYVDELGQTINKSKIDVDLCRRAVKRTLLKLGFGDYKKGKP